MSVLDRITVFAIEHAWAKSELSDLQYHGGPHISIFRVIGEVFGAPPPSVPVEADGEWGFKQWARHITAGRW